MSSRQVITHRYPWTGEEKAIIAFFSLAPAAVVGYLASTGGIHPVVGVAVPAAGLAIAGFLYRLGDRRKNASRITGVLTGTHLKVTGGRVKQSHGDIADTRSVKVTEIGPETVLLLTSDDGDVLRVPMRLAKPPLTGVLLNHLLRAEVARTEEADRVLADLPGGWAKLHALGAGDDTRDEFGAPAPSKRATRFGSRRPGESGSPSRQDTAASDSSAFIAAAVATGMFGGAYRGDSDAGRDSGSSYSSFDSGSSFSGDFGGGSF